MPSCRLRAVRNKNPKENQHKSLKAEHKNNADEEELCDEDVHPSEEDDETEKKKPKIALKDGLERWLLHTTHEMQTRMDHSFLPGFNLSQHPVQTCSELRSYPMCTLSTPRPVYIANKHCAHIDICHRRTMERSNYNRLLNIARTKYEASRKKDAKLRNAAKRNIYHTSLFDLTERLERNPDPYFHGNFDYYYTGGNLCVLPEERYIVHVDGDDLNNLSLGYFSRKRDIFKKPLKNACSKAFTGKGEIFEVRPFKTSNHKDELSNYFLMRQRNHVTLAALQTEEQENGSVQRIKGLKQFKSKKVPFISFAQSPEDRNTVLVSSMNQVVRCYDLNHETPKLFETYDLLANDNAEQISWNTIKEWRPKTFIYANEQQLCLMDLRAMPQEWLRSACGFSSNEFKCEFISSLACDYSNIFYVGTAHKLHCLDARFLKRDFEEPNGAVCRWTHQLEYAPAFMETFRLDKSEFIALASAVAGDLCICELTRHRTHEAETKKCSKYVYKSYCLPFQPPTLQEAYESARLAGKCLQPDADLKNRLRCCTTGLAFYTRDQHESADSTMDSNSMLLTSNSNGDVFAHAINTRKTQSPEERTNSSSNDIMHKYEKNICKLLQPNLNYTDVVDMKSMSKVFRCEKLNALKREEDDHVEQQNILRASLNKGKKPVHERNSLGRWQKSMQSLHSYKDALVTDLLAIWDIDYDEDDKKISLSKFNASLSKKPAPETIVDSWLKANVQVPPMTNVPVANLDLSINTYNIKFDNSLDEAPNDGEEFITEDQFITTMDNVQQSTQINDEEIVQINSTSIVETHKQRKRVKTIKNKYVKGF